MCGIQGDRRHFEVSHEDRDRHSREGHSVGRTEPAVDKLELTITVMETASQAAEAFVIISTQGTQLSMWAGFVGN